MIYLLLDCDEFLTAQRLAELKAALGDAEMADLNTTVFSGGQAGAAEILGQASMMPFLAERRLVVAEGYLSHLDKRMAASQGTDSAAHQEAARFLVGLADLPEQSDLVLIDGGLDKRRHLWRGFTLPAQDDRPARPVPGLQALIQARQIQLESQGTPDPRALPGWIQQRAQSKQIAIEPRAVQMLATFVGPNLRQLDNELDKLASYASGRPVTPDDVALLVSDASEAMIWDLTDALSQRNPRQAAHALQMLRRHDANPFYLLTMIARQYRIILKVKEAAARAAGRPANEYDIAKQVGESPYPVKKALQQARSYSFEELEAILSRLLEADHAMKTGTDPDTAIDILIAELTQRARP